jgi:RNA polymerase sigma factor (sigma-70 family)
MSVRSWNVESGSRSKTSDGHSHGLENQQLGAYHEFEVFYQREYRALLDYATKCVGNKQVAQDIVADSFVSMLVKWTDLVDRDREAGSSEGFRGYAFTVVKNRVRRYYTRELPLLDYDELTSTSTYACDSVTQRTHPDTALAILAALSDIQCRAIILVAAGFTVPEIAEKLSVLESTARGAIATARKKIRAMLGTQATVERTISELLKNPHHRARHGHINTLLAMFLAMMITVATATTIISLPFPIGRVVCPTYPTWITPIQVLKNRCHRNDANNPSVQSSIPVDGKSGPAENVQPERNKVRRAAHLTNQAKSSQIATEQAIQLQTHDSNAEQDVDDPLGSLIVTAKISVDSSVKIQGQVSPAKLIPPMGGNKILADLTTKVEETTAADTKVDREQFVSLGIGVKLQLDARISRPTPAFLDHRPLDATTATGINPDRLDAEQGQ